MAQLDNQVRSGVLRNFIYSLPISWAEPQSHIVTPITFSAQREIPGIHVLTLFSDGAVVILMDSNYVPHSFSIKYPCSLLILAPLFLLT